MSFRYGRAWSLPMAALASFGMLIWVFAEMASIRESAFLQVSYFEWGIVVLMLLGIGPGTDSTAWSLEGQEG